MFTARFQTVKHAIRRKSMGPDPRRPWINFECGAGWARSIEVVPICHSGLRPVDLPVPLSLLQGLDVTDPAALNQVFDMIAEKLKASSPAVDTNKLAATATAFSKKYVEETEVYTHLRAIKDISTELFDILGKLQADQVTPIQGVPERLVERCRTSLEELQKQGYLSFNYSINGLGFAVSGSGGGGNFGDLTMTIGTKLYSTIQSFSKRPA